MREIKFRAWIHPHCGGNVPQEIYNSLDYSDNYSLEEFFQLYENYFEIMQYTGLKDKNKKELYVGDKVDVHYFYFNGIESEANMIGFLGWREFGLTLEFVKGIHFEIHTGYSEEDNGWIYLANWNGLHEESFELIGNKYETKRK